jgi:hypothetical protein
MIWMRASLADHTEGPGRFGRYRGEVIRDTLGEIAESDTEELTVEGELAGARTPAQDSDLH